MFRTCKILTSALTWVGAGRLSSTSGSLEAGQVLADIGALLHDRHEGMRRISEILRASETPGAEPKWVDSLEGWIGTAESEIEPMIKEAQAATQTKIDDILGKFGKASSDADEAKAAANTADEAWFGCIEEEQKKKQSAEDAQAHETASQEAQTQACQAQQDNRDFSYDANRTLAFECDSAEGNCDSAYAAFVDTLETIKKDAGAKLQEHEAKYKELEEACDSATAKLEAAQQARAEADTALSNQQAQCETYETDRHHAICEYGDAVQVKCVYEDEYHKLIEDTHARNNTDSEPDREDEWSTIQQLKCLHDKSIKGGLVGGALDSSDVTACASAANFDEQVGGLNRREKEFEALAGSHQCTEDPISFYNGQAWSVPADAAASDYAKTAFSPVLNPTEHEPPFDLCA